jgi:NYN domain
MSGRRHSPCFEIVDCPLVTSQGKTSTDIHMVLDIIELLQHETRCDEFIVFSADADFTPVLRKLRRHDRRTTVLAIGFPSAAYQASADLLIDERLFLRDALGFGPTSPDPATPPVDLPADATASRPHDERQPVPAPKPSPVAAVAAKAEPRARPIPRAATPNELASIATRVGTLVDEAALPVSAAFLASRLRQEFPESLENWNGLSGFKAFFRSLRLARLVWMSGSGGKVLDPGRHDVEGVNPGQEPDSSWFGAGETFSVVREVCTLTGAPMLAPKDLGLIMSTLAKVLAQHPFQLAETARLVCGKCLETEGLRVRQRDVTYLVRGMQMNGHVFGQALDDENTLAKRLVNQIQFLCEREQKVLSAEELGHIRRWVKGTAGSGQTATIPAAATASTEDSDSPTPGPANLG